jgi:DNA (cytosine-5)-methyltransferase 1
MSESMANGNRRILKVTAGNLRQHHLYIRDHLDFFPPDCVGPSRRSKSTTTDNSIEIILDGLNQTVRTDIAADAKTGRPRSFFRGRGWVGEFFEHHQVSAGDELAFERLAPRQYRLALAPNGNGHGRKPRAAEFFAGIGLVRLALERQGWEVVFANDIDPAKAEMYRHNWPENDHLVLDDIHKLSPDQIPDCELFTASFPCNDLSIAGKWEGLNGKESSAFWGLIRILREMDQRRPAMVLLENVVGFLMSQGGRDLEQALLALNELGYAIDAVILNAKHWVPQSRARLFIIAKLDRGQDRQTVAPISDVRPWALTKFIFVNQHIHWDFQPLPTLPKPEAKLTKIVEKLPDTDKHWWSQERVDYFMAQMSPKHAEVARRLIEGKTITYTTAFRRMRNQKSMAELRTDGIAGCLRTPRGGSARQILFKAGRGRCQVRLLTARECARLQGVGDEFVIDVPLNQALAGFGDAVCVNAVEWLASTYLTHEASEIDSLTKRACPILRLKTMTDHVEASPHLSWAASSVVIPDGYDIPRRSTNDKPIMAVH